MWISAANEDLNELFFSLVFNMQLWILKFQPIYIIVQASKVAQ